jgi:hypothetical protein
MAKIRELDKVSPVSADEVMALNNVTKVAPTPEEIAKGKKALDAHQERSRLLHQVALCPAYSEAPQTLTVEGIQVPDTFPQNAQFREYARWLVAESALLLYGGKPLDAIQVDALVFRLARLSASSGSILTCLVSDAIDSLALDGMRRILYQEGDREGVAAAVVQAIETQRTAPNLGLALRGEVVVELSMSDSERHNIPEMLKGEPSKQPFEKTRAYREWKKYQYPTDPTLAFSRFIDMNNAHYLAWMRRVLPLADLPYPEALSGIKAITREAEKNAAHPDYSLAAMSFATWASLPASKARCQANAETTRAAAALLAWKTAHGQFPESLTECLRPGPLDPFDQHPLHYRKEGEGFLVYSVGETGKFDGGSLDQRPPSREILLRYPRPVYPNP